MSQQARRREQGPVAIPEDWQQPAVLRLQAKLQNEKLAYWLLVVIIALASAPLGYYLVRLVVALYYLAFTQLTSGPALPSWLNPAPGPYGLGLTQAGGLLTFTTGAALPVLIVFWALLLYRRQLSFTVHDLLAGPAALMLIDDQYARIIEEERRQHYRLNINPVSLGESFVDRVNFFAHYYTSFRQLGLGPCQLRIPTVVERNCWLDGGLSCLGGCLNTCACVGAPLTIPLLFRVLTTWTRQLAVKQAVTDYLIGHHDAALDYMAAARERGRI